MKHKFVLLLAVAMVLAIVGYNVFGADPNDHTQIVSVGDITVSVEFSDSLKCQDSLIVACSDSGIVLYEATGVVLLDPGDRFYAGFGTAAAGATCDLDTFLVVGQPREYRTGKTRLPFIFRYAVTIAAATTDTAYFFVAAGGSGSGEAVEVQDCWFTAIVQDNISD